MPGKERHDWTTLDPQVVAKVRELGAVAGAAAALGMSRSTVEARVSRTPDLAKAIAAARAAFTAEQNALPKARRRRRGGVAESYTWPPDDELVARIASIGYLGVAAEIGCSDSRVHQQVRDHNLRDRVEQARVGARVPDAGEAFVEEVHARLKKAQRNAPIAVEQLADDLDCPPRHIRDALAVLKERGFRVAEKTDEPSVELQKVDPDTHHLYRGLLDGILDGDTIRLGVISDTHLNSKECALDHLHLAYDRMLEEGVTKVIHPGDLVAGRGIYRGQDKDLINHTFKTQVDYAVREYPRRPGIENLIVSGNHDIEGDFGKIGANPVQAVANRRDDFNFLGDYGAWVELPNGGWLHQMHGSGGMGYAYSYKVQKLVDGYPSGRKPAILIPGHWHVRGCFEHRGVEVLFPACFEWQTDYLARKGLHPAVGFHILDLTLADDGSLVRSVPHWHKFWEGRVIAAAAAA